MRTGEGEGKRKGNSRIISRESGRRDKAGCEKCLQQEQKLIRHNILSFCQLTLGISGLVLRRTARVGESNWPEKS